MAINEKCYIPDTGTFNVILLFTITLNDEPAQIGRSAPICPHRRCPAPQFCILAFADRISVVGSILQISRVVGKLLGEMLLIYQYIVNNKNTVQIKKLKIMHAFFNTTK
jgi:hypothetical protein